jgi:hypothetical protein
MPQKRSFAKVPSLGRSNLLRSKKAACRAAQRPMFSKIVIALALASLAVVALEFLGESENGAALEQEVAGQLDALRKHLFRR